MYGLADVRHSTKSVPWGYSIVLAADAGPRVPSGGVTLKRRCTYRPSVIYLIVNKLLSLSLSLSLTLLRKMKRIDSLIMKRIDPNTLATH